MHLIQWISSKHGRGVGYRSIETGDSIMVLEGAGSTLELAQQALAQNRPLESLVRSVPATAISSDRLLDTVKLLPAVDHPNPQACLVSGTGLTHLGSAKPRNAMNSKKDQAGTPTDTMRMFQTGLDGGKPTAGQIGAQPEWFYKGDGSCVVPSNSDLMVPAFGLDAGEEPELVGCYLIDDQGQPYRLGFALGNECSDHITEKQNYLYLAHSKLRPCSIGPELLLGSLPQEVTGCSRIIRDAQIIWQQDFVSGEAHMAHSIANLEHHHFKYAAFRQVGQLHYHFLGTSTLSIADGITTQDGDRFEISANCFSLPLSNTLRVVGDPDTLYAVRQL